MKKYILPLLCSSCLLHAEGQPSATAIFDQLLPAAAATVSSKGSLAEQHPSLAAIPADADLCITLSQLSKSYAALASYIPALAGRAPLITPIIEGIDDLSLALGKDGIEQLTQLSAAMDLLERAALFNRLDLKGRDAETRKKFNTYSTAQAQAMTLPDIIISAQLQPALMAQAKLLLAQLPHMITPELSIPLGDGNSISGISLTQIGDYQALQGELTLYGHKKSYTLLYKTDADKLTIIGSARPESLASPRATENSMLANPQAQSLPVDKDVTLLLQDRDIAMDIATMLITIAEGRDQRWSTSDESDEEEAKLYALLRAKLPALLPYLEQGLQASLTLAPSPELELSWQDARYRFIPTATRALPHIAKSESMIESSAVELPDFLSFFKELNAILLDEEAAALIDIFSTTTGQACIIDWREDVSDTLGYVAIKDEPLVRKSIAFLHSREPDYVLAGDGSGRYVQHKPEPGTLPDDTTLLDHGFIVCDEAALRDTFAQSPVGPVQAGILLRFKLDKKLPPFSALYGRWSNEGKTHTVKLRLTK